MPKISTRRSTTLIHVERGKDLQSQEQIEITLPVPEKEPEKRESARSSPAELTEAVPERAIDLQPKVERAPVPSKPLTTPPSSTVSSSSVASASQPAVRSNDIFMRLLVGGAAAALLISLAFRTNSKTSSPDEMAKAGDLASFFSEDDGLKLSHSQWKNDEPSMLTKPFRKLCIGYAKSDGCSNEPLHPLKSVAEQLGKELTFAHEPDHRIIEQTIEYRSKAFELEK